MNFINPSALFFGLLALPIIVLYLLKIRRRELEVSSTLLWRRALRDQQANAPWQKLRRNILLLLQLIILSGIVLALARLAFPAAVIATGSIVVILDGSASMQATDVPPSRFAAAVAAAKELARDAGSDSRITLILADHQPRIVTAQTDPSPIIAALDTLAVSPGEADWSSALALAAGLGNANHDTTYVIISDGGIPSGGLPPLPGEVRYVAIGSGDDNLAISAFDIRPLPGATSGEAELFVRVSNLGSADRLALLSIRADGGREVLRQQVSVPGGGSVTLTLEDAGALGSAFEAALSNLQPELPLDFREADDHAYAVYAPQARRRVFLVSNGNLFIERLLLILPNVEPLRVRPNNDGLFTLPAGLEGVVILDGVIPAGGIPPNDLLILNPPENELFEVAGEFELPTSLETADHPLVRSVDLGSIHVAKAKLLTVPAWGETLITSAEGVLVFAGSDGNRRLAVVAFDLHQSDLPLQIAFPILFANLLDYLSPQQVAEEPNGTRVLEEITLTPGTGVTGLVVTTPAGEAIPVGLDSSPVIFRETAQAGLYRIETTSELGTAAEYAAVNPSAGAESDLAVAPGLAVGLAEVQATGADEVSNAEILAWLILLTLAFLLVEWLADRGRSARMWGRAG
jgi:hypothetical protein